MSNEKVLLTYKRKRFLCQTDVSNDTKITNLAFDISRDSSVDAHDEEFKNSYTNHFPATKETKKCKTMEKQDMEHVVLRSCELLNSTNAIGSFLSKPGCSLIHPSLNNEKDTTELNRLNLSSTNCADGNSSAICAVDSQIGNSVHLTENTDSEAKQFGSDFSLVGSKMTLNSDGGAHTNICGDESMRLRSKSPLITFFRRRSKGKHVQGESFTGGGSFQDPSFELKVNCTPTFLEKCVVCISNAELAHVMPNVNLAATAECTNAEISAGLDLKRVETDSEFLVPPISKESHAMQSVVKDKILPLDKEPSNSGDNDFSLTREISGNKFITDKDSCEKSQILDASDERYPSADLQLSAVPVSTSHENPVTSKQLDVFVPPNCITSERPVAQCCPILLTYEKNDSRNKELEWLENLDKVLSEKNKCKNARSSNVHDNINCREASSSIMAEKANLAVNYQVTRSDNANLPKNLPEKLSARLVDHFAEEHQDKEKLTFTDFLGVCPSSNPCGLIDLNSTPAPASSSVRPRGRVNMQHRDLPSRSSDGNPSFFMQRQIAEISIADLTSRGRHGYLSEMPKRYSNQWSEEELDFLWIGVRRHGTSNWNAVLRDPKLCFVESRTPDDLALQWEHEQKKVFNDTFPPAMHSKPSFFSSSFLDGQPENPIHAAETKLSLGGVYFPKENIPSTGRFHPLGFGITFPSTSECSSSCVLPGSYLSVSKYPRLSTRQQMLSAASTTMYQTENGCYKRFSEGSAQEQQQQAGTHLPHWLKDVSSSHPSRRELSSWPHFASGNDASCSNNETAICLPGSSVAELLATSKDLRGRGILKRKSAVFGIASGSVRIREPSPSVAESASGIRPGVVLSQSQTSERPALYLGASHAVDLGCNASTPIMASELVVIDSDLSSEETISDDQSSRP